MLCYPSLPHSLPLSHVSDSVSEARKFFEYLVSFVILYNNLVPISLIVTLEVRGHIFAPTLIPIVCL